MALSLSLSLSHLYHTRVIFERISIDMGRIILVEIPEESHSEPSWPEGWHVFLPEEAKDRPSQLKHNRLGVPFIQFQEYQFLSPVIWLVRLLTFTPCG